MKKRFLVLALLSIFTLGINSTEREKVILTVNINKTGVISLTLNDKAAKVTANRNEKSTNLQYTGKIDSVTFSYNEPLNKVILHKLEGKYREGAPIQILAKLSEIVTVEGKSLDLSNLDSLTVWVEGKLRHTVYINSQNVEAKPQPAKPTVPEYTKKDVEDGVSYDETYKIDSLSNDSIKVSFQIQNRLEMPLKNVKVTINGEDQVYTWRKKNREIQSTVKKAEILHESTITIKLPNNRFAIFDKKIQVKGDVDKTLFNHEYIIPATNIWILIGAALFVVLVISFLLFLLISRKRYKRMAAWVVCLFKPKKGSDLLQIIEQQEEKIKNLEQQIGIFGTKQDELQTQVNKQTKRVNKAKNIIKYYKNKIKGEYINIAEYENVLKDTSDEITALQEEIGEIQGDITYFERVLTTEYISIRDHKKLCNSLQFKSKNASDQHAAVITERDTYKEIVSAKELQIQSLKYQLEAQVSEFVKLKGNHDEIKKVLGQKNIYYVNIITETLNELSAEFSSAFCDVADDNIRQKVILPLIKGVSGLSSGIIAYADKFQNEVLNNMDIFFGKDYFVMNEKDVKETLAEHFIINVIKLDSFSKFVRLYLMSTVPWIHEQLVKKNVDVELYAYLFHKMKSLVSLFGVKLVYPKLFEETFTNQSCYQWNESTEVFDVFELSDELRKKLSRTDIIVDLIQLGYETASGVKRRAIIATPNF